MNNTITITTDDVLMIAEALSMVVNYKRKVLSERSLSIFEQAWLPSAIEQIESGTFKLNNSKKNFFVWMVDQMNHCNKFEDGMDPKDGIPMNTTKLGRDVKEICELAVKGQREYNKSKLSNNFDNLFN